MSLHRGLIPENIMKMVTISQDVYEKLLKSNDDLIGILVNDEQVSISKEEYKQLLDTQKKLNALYAANPYAFDSMDD